MVKPQVATFSKPGEVGVDARKTEPQLSETGTGVEKEFGSRFPRGSMEAEC
jgi:hypothetical protein